MTPGSTAIAMNETADGGVEAELLDSNEKIIVSVDNEQSEKSLPSTDDENGDEDEGDDAMYVGNKTKGMQLPIDDEHDYLHMNSLDNIDNDMYASDNDVVTPMVVVNEGNMETKGDNDDSDDDDNDILYRKSSKGGTKKFSE